MTNGILLLQAGPSGSRVAIFAAAEGYTQKDESCIVFSHTAIQAPLSLTVVWMGLLLLSLPFNDTPEKTLAATGISPGLVLFKSGYPLLLVWLKQRG